MNIIYRFWLAWDLLFTLGTCLLPSCSPSWWLYLTCIKLQTTEEPPLWFGFLEGSHQWSRWNQKRYLQTIHHWGGCRWTRRCEGSKCHRWTSSADWKFDSHFVGQNLPKNNENPVKSTWVPSYSSNPNTLEYLVISCGQVYIKQRQDHETVSGSWQVSGWAAVPIARIYQYLLFIFPLTIYVLQNITHLDKLTKQL